MHKINNLATVIDAEVTSNRKAGAYPVSYTHLTLPTNREV